MMHNESIIGRIHNMKKKKSENEWRHLLNGILSEFSQNERIIWEMDKIRA